MQYVVSIIRVWMCVPISIGYLGMSEWYLQRQSPDLLRAGRREHTLSQGP